MAEIRIGSDDSDDESLPELSTILPLQLSTDISNLSNGDIVWAKFKKLYWPALVRSVHKKEKKVHVWFTDDPGKTFKLPFKKICSFHDPKMTKKIKMDVREAGCVQEHEGLTAHAIGYLTRRAQGFVDDPMKFFDQTYPFYLIEEHLKKNPGADVSGIKIEPLYISHQKKSFRKSGRVQNIPSSSIESDPESVSSDSESDIEEVPKDYLSKFFQIFTASTEEDKKKIDNIVNFVKSGKADNYLKKILDKHVPSKHRDAYEKEIVSNKKIRNPLSFTGPIDDDNSIRELIFYLLDLKNKIPGTSRGRVKLSRMCKKEVVNNLSYNKLSDTTNAQYVASVWLPESIIYAMSHVYNVSLEEARELFEKKPTSDSKGMENIFQLLDSDTTTMNPEVTKKKCNYKSDNIEMNSPSKKICPGKSCKK